MKTISTVFVASALLPNGGLVGEMTSAERR
jgi:hypothetical protein